MADPTQAVETETIETDAQAAPVTTTEEQFDKERAMSTITKLREIEKQAKKDAAELAQYKAEKAKRDEAELSEAERLKSRAEQAEAKAAKLETDMLRRDVIAEAGLPAIFTDRLKGATREELLADAQELAKTLPTIKTAPHLSATNPSNASLIETDAQKRARLFGEPGNPFDMDNLKAKGGGVVWNK